MDALLQVRNLSVRYCGEHGAAQAAVADLCFEIGAGEVVGLAGESGCGKTTVAQAVLGLLPEDSAECSGEVVFHRQNLRSVEERALERIRGAEISLMSQDPSLALSPLLQAGEQIAEVLRAHKNWSWKSCCEEARSWLVRVGLEPARRFFSAYPHQLSGGELQRVALAQAVVCGPRLLIADEPTAALDARNQAAFVRLLRDLKTEMNLSVLLISHTPEIQASLADRILVMREGRIVEQGTFAQLYVAASDPYTRALLRPSLAFVATRSAGDNSATTAKLLAP